MTMPLRLVLSIDGQNAYRTGIGASFGTWRGYKAVYLTQAFC